MRWIACLALAACSSAVRAPLYDDFTGRTAVRCEPKGIDVDAENEKATALALAIDPGAVGYHALIVPGFTPKNATEPLIELDPIAKERLFRAVLALQRRAAPIVIVSGGNVYPKDTPVNEALLMKRYLRALGVPEERILIEPCSRYSYTNLRNAGRLMLSVGMWRGLVITSYDQAFYLGRPGSSTFRTRSQTKLGYFVGDMKIVNGQDVSFVPSRHVFDHGKDPLDP